VAKDNVSKGMLLYGSSFSLRIRRPIERSTANEISKVTEAIEMSMAIACEGNIIGNINAGNIGIIPIITPRG